MAEPFLGQISLFSFNFPPRGWAQCAGQLLPVQQYQPLFSLLGTTYGGDGRTTFALPDLRGRIAVSVGQGLTLGQRAGSEVHLLSVNEIASHNHFLRATSVNANTNSPNNTLLASSPGKIYANSGATNVELSRKTITTAGGGQPHENRQPHLVMGFCIALVGVWPSPS